MRESNKFPGYLIDEDGKVFNKSDNTPIKLIKGQYRLQSAEVFTTLSGKKSLIVRRVTPEEMKAYFKNAKPIEFKKAEAEGPDIVHTLVIKATIKPKETPPKLNAKKVCIDGVDFESANAAAKALGVSVNTVINRCRNRKFDNYLFV